MCACIWGDTLYLWPQTGLPTAANGELLSVLLTASGEGGRCPPESAGLACVQVLGAHQGAEAHRAEDPCPRVPRPRLPPGQVSLSLSGRKAAGRGFSPSLLSRPEGQPQPALRFLPRTDRQACAHVASRRCGSRGRGRGGRGGPAGLQAGGWGAQPAPPPPPRGHPSLGSRSLGRGLGEAGLSAHCSLG